MFSGNESPGIPPHTIPARASHKLFTRPGCHVLSLMLHRRAMPAFPAPALLTPNASFSAR